MVLGTQLVLNKENLCCWVYSETTTLFLLIITDVFMKTAL